MEWYTDVRMLEWRVVQIAKEILIQMSGRRNDMGMLES
jgi:hypothetical protein